MNNNSNKNLEKMQCIKNISKIIKTEPIDYDIIHISNDNQDHQHPDHQHQQQQLSKSTTLSLSSPSSSSSTQQLIYSQIDQKVPIHQLQLQQHQHQHQHQSQQQQNHSNQKVILSPRIDYHNSGNGHNNHHQNHHQRHSRSIATTTTSAAAATANNKHYALTIETTARGNAIGNSVRGGVGVGGKGSVSGGYHHNHHHHHNPQIHHHLGNDPENNQHSQYHNRSRSSSISPIPSTSQQQSQQHHLQQHHQQIQTSSTHGNGSTGNVGGQQIIITRTSGMKPLLSSSTSPPSPSPSGSNSGHQNYHHHQQQHHRQQQHISHQQQQVRVIRDGRFYDETKRNSISPHSPPPLTLVGTSSLSSTTGSVEGATTRHIHNYDSHHQQQLHLSDIKVSCSPPPSPSPSPSVCDESVRQQQQQQQQQQNQSTATTTVATVTCIPRKYIISRHVNVISSNKYEMCNGSVVNNTSITSSPPSVNCTSSSGNSSGSSHASNICNSVKNSGINSGNSNSSGSGSGSASSSLSSSASSSSSSAQIFRTPVVSSSSGSGISCNTSHNNKTYNDCGSSSNSNNNIINYNSGGCLNNNNNNNNNNSAATSMRPPPPPPPPKIKQNSSAQAIPSVNISEEPSSSIPDLEFDGTTVLCRVCGDKASGFHYGVHSCEGCKGFFRRSIQQKIQYRPCTKNQQCSILRINRNRCQYCRLKKCIAVGMSRDAVRFGRVPKREKARILAAMQQSTQNRGQQRALATELDDPPKLLAAVLRAHMETCEFTKDKVATMRERARECPSYSMPTLLACPLNPAPELQSEQEFSQRFAHVIRGVIDFAGMIPGFQYLTQDDKFTLLKAGLFDALFVRLICMFDSSINSIICLNGQVMRRDAIQNGANARFLVDSTFNFAERMNSMNLSDTEIGLFCAIVLITPDRPGLRNIELIEKMYTSLKGCLQQVISQNRPDQPEFMSELLKLLPDLRTLSTLHTEKLVVFRTEHKELLRQQMWSMDDDQPSKSPGSSTWDAREGIEDVAKSPLGSVSSTESGDLEYSQSSLVSSAPLLAATLSGTCPLRHRANSGSSAEDVDIVGSHAHLTQNGLTITPVARPHSHLNNRYRKLDSPTDSGIESGNEKTESTKTVSSGGSSSCSSPRSSVDDALDENAAASAGQAQNSSQIGTKRQIVEDMPVLKRVLQAPPLYDTNSLMDEAYKPHKKFRALRHREFETAEADANIPSTPVISMPTHPVQSQLHMHLTRNTNSSNIRETPNNNNNKEREASYHQTQHSSLSSTHSVLAKSLMEEPRMTPEQMKRTDIIQNYIMREQPSNGLLVCATSPAHPQCPYSGSPTASSTSSNSNCSSPSTTAVTLASPPPPPPHTMRWQGHSVITTTTLRQQHSSSPSSIVVGNSNSSNNNSSNYFQSPHSTSVSPPRPSPSAQSPRLLELQVDIADSQQPLNLSKKSPTPPPTIAQQTTKLLARQYPVAADVTVTATTSPAGAAAATSQVHKVLLEA